MTKVCFPLVERLETIHETIVETIRGGRDNTGREGLLSVTTRRMTCAHSQEEDPEVEVNEADEVHRVSTPTCGTT